MDITRILCNVHALVLRCSQFNVLRRILYRTQFNVLRRTRISEIDTKHTAYTVINMMKMMINPWNATNVSDAMKKEDNCATHNTETVSNSMEGKEEHNAIAKHGNQFFRRRLKNAVNNAYISTTMI